LRVSRFRDVATTASATLTLDADASANYDLGWALGRARSPRDALDHHSAALGLYRAADDRGNEAATLNNIGLVYDALGNRQAALEHYHQALPITRDVGDRQAGAALAE
jgi:tetratricopeptide (TPR) repeat protein